MTHQEHSKMCEVITETTGLIWRNTLGFTAAAVPTTPPTWHTHTHTSKDSPTHAHKHKSFYQQMHSFKSFESFIKFRGLELQSIN